MFSRYAIFGDDTVGLLVFLAQRVLLAAFFGHRRLTMDLGQAHVAGIDDGFGLGTQSDSGLLEQSKVMTAPRVVSKADDPGCRPIDDELGLQRVAFFLARAVPALFF